MTEVPLFKTLKIEILIDPFLKKLMQSHSRYRQQALLKITHRNA